MGYMMIGVILINYKDYAEKFLAPCRDSLRAQVLEGNTLQVYIVDNVTSEETRASIATIYPEAIVIGSEGNGWGYGNNVGMKRAITDGCDAVILANMDTVFEPVWAQELIAPLSHKEIGITQSKILLYNTNPPRLNSRGNVLQFLGFSFCVGYNEIDNQEEKELVDIGSASGVALAMTSKTAQEIGMCDESYFMYHDDVELSLKVTMRGKRIVMVPTSRVAHKYEFSRSIRQVYFMERNRYLVLFTFFPLPLLIASSPLLLGMELAMWVYAIKNGWGKQKMKVLQYFLKKETWQAIRHKRKEQFTQRTITNAQFTEKLVATVDFQEVQNPLLRYVGNPIMRAYFSILKNIT